MVKDVFFEMKKIKRIVLNCIYFVLGLVNQRLLVSFKYYYILGRKINWKTPCDINEKINWLKFYSETSLWTECADKYKVRDYVRRKGLDNILVPLYGAWENPKQIDFNVLPEQFVLKTNNGSGTNIVVKDKNKLNFDNVRKELSLFMNKRFGFMHGEPHYEKIKPMIIAEQLLVQDGDFTNSLIDYKVWCFNGKPKYIWVCYNRTPKEVYVSLYDTDWNYHPEYSVFTDHFKDGGNVIPKPSLLTEMLRAASVLSEDTPQLRCDFYIINNKVYFGEMTFSRSGGYMDFYTRAFLNELGAYVVVLN